MRIGGRGSICHLKNALRKTVERAAAAGETRETQQQSVSMIPLAFSLLSLSLSFDQVSKQTTKEKERKVTLHQPPQKKRKIKNVSGMERRYTQIHSQTKKYTSHIHTKEIKGTTRKKKTISRDIDIFPRDGAQHLLLQGRNKKTTDPAVNTG